MITKTGIEYSENSNLSNSTTIEVNGEQNSITIPSWPAGTNLYCQAYVIDDGTRINSSIEHYIKLDYFHFKNEYAGQNTITFTVSRGAPGDFEYSKDKVNWTTVTNANATTTVVMEEGEKVYIRAPYTLNNNISFPAFWGFNCNKIYSIGGDIGTLDNYSLNATRMNMYNCYELFKNSTTLIDASQAYFDNIEELGNSALCNMFSGCSNLRTAPNMSGIITVESAAMGGTFLGTAITTINLNSVTTVGSSALNNTFKNSQIESIVIGANLYSVGDFGFNGCFTNSKLKVGIDFRNVVNWTTYCLQLIYDGCTELYEAIYPRRTNITDGWLRNAGTNVQGTKTVYCPTGVSIPSDNSGVPSGWTRVDY